MLIIVGAQDPTVCALPLNAVFLAILHNESNQCRVKLRFENIVGLAPSHEESIYPLITH